MQIRFQPLVLVVVSAIIGAAFAQEEKTEKKPEVAPAPTVGAAAPPFTAKSTSGREIKFPESYKGKIVLLDFWATWCPPCRMEVPGLVAAYNKYHDKGLEIVGISRDQSRQITVKALGEFTATNKMLWEQIYEGTDAIGRAYGVHFIPSPYLIDGTTGKIIAMGEDLMGAKLAATIEKHLPKSVANNAGSTSEKKETGKVAEKRSDSKKESTAKP